MKPLIHLLRAHAPRFIFYSMLLISGIWLSYMYIPQAEQIDILMSDCTALQEAVHQASATKKPPEKIAPCISSSQRTIDLIDTILQHATALEHCNVQENNIDLKFKVRTLNQVAELLQAISIQQPQLTIAQAQCTYAQEFQKDTSSFGYHLHMHGHYK